MSEEIREETNEVDNNPQIDPPASAAAESAPNRLPIYIVAGTIGIVVVFAVLFWYFRGSSGGGQVVAPPRNVTFGDKGSEQSSDTSGEQTVTIQLDQVEKIGLKIETVGETLSGEAMSVAATGVVQPDAYKETPLISLLGGVVRKVNVELGDNVQKGQTLAIVFSEELAAAESDYLAMVAETDEATKRYSRALKLTDIAQESRTELDQAISDVKIAEADQSEHMSHFHRSVKLLEIGAISREEYEMVRSKHETAMAKLDEANKRLDRAKKLLEINPQRHAELDAALTQKRTAEAKTGSGGQKLMVYGLSPQQVSQLRVSRRVSSELPLRSPVSGTVTARSVNSGEIVEANKDLMRITNLSGIWVIAQVYEKDLNLLRNGSGASVTTDAYPGRLFRGHVTYIDPNIDQATRTAQVRVELENPGRVLKIGMYVNVAFGSMGTAEHTMPVVPSTAVQNMIDKQIVFAATDKPNVFTVRQVRLGKENDGNFTVIEGLNVGDRIVTDGSFLLRAELLKQNPSQ